MRFNRRGVLSAVIAAAMAAIPAPVNTVAPAITGTALVGQTLTVAPGTWSYSPTSTTYQWKYDGVSIPLATGLTHVLEPARTNLLLQSQTFNTTWSLSRSAIVADQTAAPDGATTADVLRNNETTASGYYYAYQNITLTQGTTYTLTVYAKPKTGAGIIWLGAPDNSFAWFNLGTGAVGTKYAGISSSSITAVANGFYRCRITFTKTSATSSAQIGVGLATADNAPSFTPGAIGAQEVYVWQADLITAPAASAPIVTGAATVTRGLPTSVTCVETATNAAGSTSATSNGIGPVTQPIPTYAEFEAAETARATAGERAWSATVNSNGIYWTTVLTAAGAMSGSPLAAGNSRVATGSNISRFVQHAFPDATAFNAYGTAGRKVFYTLPSGTSDVPTIAVNRSGFLSDSTEGENTPCKVTFTDFRLYDPTVGPVILNLAAGTTTPYTP